MIDFVNVTNKELLNYLLDQKIIFNKHFNHNLVEDFLYDFYMIELDRENLKGKNFFGFYPILPSENGIFNFAPEQYTKIYISFGVTFYKKPLCFNINGVYYEGTPSLSIDKNHYFIKQSKYNFDFTSQIDNNRIPYSYLEQNYTFERNRSTIEQNSQFYSSGPSFIYNNIEYFYYVYKKTDLLKITPFQLLNNLMYETGFLLSNDYIKDIITLDKAYNRVLQIGNPPPKDCEVIDDFQLTDANDKFPKPYDILSKY